MRFFLTMLLTALLSFIAGLFFPWWTIAIVAFVVALFIRPSIGLGFLSGFLGIFLLWFLLAFWIDMENESILSRKVALILPLEGNAWLLMLVTALAGAVVGGFAAMAGSSLSFIVKRRSLVN